MKRTGLLAGPLLVLFTLLLTAWPALAQEGNLEPAIPSEPVPETTISIDWTYRYLIPTALVIAVALVILTTIRYFTNVVRRRYRIVEE